MKIVFTGDLFLGGDLLSFTGPSIIIPEFHNADLRICNLEQGSGDNQGELNKSTVSAPLSSLSYLNANKINIVSLANNHIQDKGEEGFKQKLQFLENNGIRYAGGGSNIREASKALELGDGYYLLSFCTYGKDYLRKVQLADDKTYGVNPLDYENIEEIVNKLPANAKAILLMHWGRENVWLPPASDISLAKKILKLNKVHSIIGMHSHRMQGRLSYNGKVAYFSLGNFLFPNFYMMPRTQIVYPDNLPEKYHVTHEYHPVFSLTYKKWKLSNRISKILQFDTSSGRYSSVFVKQDSNIPVVRKVNYLSFIILSVWYWILSGFLLLPGFIYKPLEIIWRITQAFIRYFNIFIFYLLRERKFLEVLMLRKS